MGANASKESPVPKVEFVEPLLNTTLSQHLIQRKTSLLVFYITNSIIIIIFQIFIMIIIHTSLLSKSLNFEGPYLSTHN